MTKKFLFATATFVACTMATAAQAVPYQSTTAPVPATITIGFEGTLPDDTVLSKQYAGVTFTNLFQTSGYDFTNFSGKSAANFTAAGTNSGPVVTIDFDNVVSSAIVNYISNSGTSTFSTFLNGALVETAIFATTTDGKFTGFQNSAFNRLTLSAAGTMNRALVIDNLSFSPTTAPVASAVPEPASWAMMTLGVGAAGGSLRRRKAKTTTGVVFA